MRPTVEYAFDPNWPHGLQGMDLGFTQGVACDHEDRVFVLCSGADPVVVLSREGDVVERWGSEWTGGAHGLTYVPSNGAGELWLTDFWRGVVKKTSLSGSPLLELDVPPIPEYRAGRPYMPTEVAVSSHGDIFVADGYGCHLVHRYAPNGSYIDSFGGKGSGPGQFDVPHGLCVRPGSGGTEEVLIADRCNCRIQVFDLLGQHMRTISDGIGFPSGVCLSDDLLIVPDIHSRVTILEADGTVLCNVGEDQNAWRHPDWPRLGRQSHKLGSFVAPHAACANSDNDLFVVEWVPEGRITKLARTA